MPTADQSKLNYKRHQANKDLTNRKNNFQNIRSDFYILRAIIM